VKKSLLAIFLSLFFSLPAVGAWGDTKMVRSTDGGDEDNIAIFDEEKIEGKQWIKDSGIPIGQIGEGTNAWGWIGIYSNCIVYVCSRTNEFDGWSNAWEWVTDNSNGVAFVFSWTNQFDNFSNAWAWVDSNSNEVAFVFSWTNQYGNWSNGWDWITDNSNCVEYMCSRTDEWDKAVIDAIFGTNWIVTWSNQVAQAVTNEVDPVWSGVSNLYATTNWVISLGYVTANITNGLATTNWVLSQSYVTASITNGLASTNWVVAQGYSTDTTNGLASTNWVISLGYVTSSITNGLASTNWVTSQGFLTACCDWWTNAPDTAITFPTNSWVAGYVLTSDDGTNWYWVVQAGVGGDTNAIWGNITGTLANQLDLVSTVAHAASAHSITANGGFQAGTGASAILGGAVGKAASARWGGAVGSNASARDGGAVGYSTSVNEGGAVGRSAKTSDGFAGGKYAYATDDGTESGTGIDAIQLGTGGNTVPGTLQVYTHLIVDANGNVYKVAMTNGASQMAGANIVWNAVTGQFDGPDETLWEVDVGTGCTQLKVADEVNIQDRFFYLDTAKAVRLVAVGGSIQVGLGAGETLDMNVHKIECVVDPTADQDAATKKYVDDNVIVASYASIGIWGMNSGMEVVMLANVLTTEVGFWKMNTSGEIMLSGNQWSDSFWTTNVLGEVIIRNVP